MHCGGRFGVVRSLLSPLSSSSSLLGSQQPHPRHLSTLVTTMATKRVPASYTLGAKPNIWVEFTNLAAVCKAVNLGQGFPDSAPPDFVVKHLVDVAKDTTNWQNHQYTRGFGHVRLVNILSKLYSHLYGVEVKPLNDILCVVGAYLGLYYTFRGWINPGDEVIILEPAYDCYAPQVRCSGGTPVPVVLKLREGATSSADFVVDVAAVEAAITPKTKILVVNNPHNPTGKLFTREELEALANIAKKHDLIVVADEVYEWHIYPGHEMIRMASLPGMYERTISVGSAGKAFSATGWKLGWVVAPEHLLHPLRVIHQDCVFTLPTVIQEAVARAFEEELPLVLNEPKKSYLRTHLAASLLPKRDGLAEYLKKAGMNPILPDAGYFMLADYSKIVRTTDRIADGPYNGSEHGTDPKDFRFARWLCKEKKLAMIPPTAFYSEQFKQGHEHLIRICFFKKDETIDAAKKILNDLQS